jgi:hypothetical protein
MLNLWTYPSWRMPELPPVEPWKRHEERTLRDFWVGKMRVREDEKVRRRGEPEEECDRITSSVLCVCELCASVKCGTRLLGREAVRGKEDRERVRGN